MRRPRDASAKLQALLTSVFLHVLWLLPTNYIQIHFQLKMLFVTLSWVFI